MRKAQSIPELHQEQPAGQWTMPEPGSRVKARNDNGHVNITLTGEDDSIRRHIDVAEEETNAGVNGRSDPENSSGKATEGRYYNTIIGTSRNAGGRVRYCIGALVTEQDIIGLARDECDRSGESLVDLAGIEWKTSEAGDREAAREWEPGEEFYTAITKLNDEGRLYEIYDCESEVTEFLDRAEKLGMGNEAWGKRRVK